MQTTFHCDVQGIADMPFPCHTEKEYTEVKNNKNRNGLGV